MALITIDLTGTTPDASTLTFSQNGLTMTLSAGLFHGRSGEDFSVYEYTPVLNTTADGVGALNPYRDLEVGFDGDGKQELAVFAFSQTVRIAEIGFTPLTNRYNLDATNTSFRLFRDGLVADPSNTTIDYSDLANDFDIYGTQIGIGAHTRYDHFRIRYITVEWPNLDTAADLVVLKSLETSATLGVLANDQDARQFLSVDTTGLTGSVSSSAD